MTDQPFQIGDAVTSPWDPINADFIRKVTAVHENRDFSSGWAVSADDGGHPSTKPILLVDSSWFFHAHLCAPLK